MYEDIRCTTSKQNNTLTELIFHGINDIRNLAPALMDSLWDEYERQKNSLMMVASCSLVSPAVLACQGMVPVNVTAEGYPGARYHAGCAILDNIESYAIDLAKSAFNARYANVQPHSASTANEIVMFSLLEPNDVILGMDLNSGGHLSHGASISFSGTYFKSVKYGLDDDYQIDLNKVEALAIQHKPKLIICGTTAYSREIDFRAFRDIADRVGAYLLADISHISGLVIAGLHPSPIDIAHITTTCTHKQIFGPRGGLILAGDSYDIPIKIRTKNKTLKEHMQNAVFPFFQGAPMMNMIAGKAMALKIALTQEYKQTMVHIQCLARALANYLISIGYDIVSKGTDTHLILIDLDNKAITGDVAENLLEQCNIIVNRNNVPNRSKQQKEPAGIRIGTNSLAQRGFTIEDIIHCGELIDYILTRVVRKADGTFCITEEMKRDINYHVLELCKKNPIPGYI